MNLASPDEVYISDKKYTEVLPGPIFRTGHGNIHYLDLLIVSGNKGRYGAPYTKY